MIEAPQGTQGVFFPETSSPEGVLARWNNFQDRAVLLRETNGYVPSVLPCGTMIGLTLGEMKRLIKFGNLDTKGSETYRFLFQRGVVDVASGIDDKGVVLPSNHPRTKPGFDSAKHAFDHVLVDSNYRSAEEYISQIPEIKELIKYHFGKIKNLMALLTSRNDQVPEDDLEKSGAFISLERTLKRKGKKNIDLGSILQSVKDFYDSYVGVVISLKPEKEASMAFETYHNERFRQGIISRLELEFEDLMTIHITPAASTALDDTFGNLEELL